MLVLLHCNKFFGRIIEGCEKRFLREYIPPSLRGRVSFSVKIGIANSCFMENGCCASGELRRRLALTEHHFLDIHPGDWDLYVTKYSGSQYKTQNLLQFVLVPRDENCDHKGLSGWEFWKLIGTCRASVMRIDLHHHLKRYQLPSGDVCTHMEIFIDKLLDRKWKNRVRNRG